MKNWRGLWLPDGEQHLIEWMDKRNEIINGKPTYQYHKLRAAVDLVPIGERKIALDIGAHCGLWSMHLVNEFQHVHAFEPMLAHRLCFEANLAGVENYELHSCALGDHTDNVQLTTGPASSGDTWVIPVGSAAPVATSALMVRLDDWQLAPSFIKIDCEGYELPILRGAVETLRRYRPALCVEQKPGHASRFGFGDTEAVTWLEAHGYRVAGVLSGDYLMVPL